MNRPSIAEQEDLVKESLFKFLRKHIPSAQLSSIDEIVLSYVVSILEDLGTEASVEEAFDVEGFCEMMAAYFPEFSTIHHNDVCQWMFELEATLSQKKGKDDESEIFAKNISILSLPQLVKPRTHTDSENGNETKRVHQLSENSDGSSDSSGDYFIGQEETVYDPEQVHLLQEMFPSACSIEVRHCLAIAEGDVGRAAQLVLHRQEAGQSLMPHSGSLNSVGQRQKSVVDDQELKSRIIARYSYVDKDDDVREHRPVGPKSEPKKLVRYRDNKIVSLKGERFTEVKKDEEEDMKKTYVSIKPARQYRFH